MRLSISHETTYHYDDQVRASIQYLRLTPHDSERQQVLSWQLALPRPVRAQIDPFGNILHVLTLDEPHEAIVIGARGQVEIDEKREAEHESQSSLPFLRFTRLTEPDEAIRAFAAAQTHKHRPHRIDRYDACAQRAHHLHAGRYSGRYQCRPGVRQPCGCLSGSHPRVPCLCPQSRGAGALCVGLSLQ